MSDAAANDPFGVASDPLLAPIPGGSPAGEDLRYDAVYDRIQEARREEDSTAPQGIWSVKLKRAEWSTVRDEAVAALSTRTKDLQLAAWLAEAWLALDGLSGLTRGVRLITALSSAFWPEAYPKLQDDDAEIRLAPFFWMESRLPERVGQVLITGRHGPDDAALSWQAMVSAQRLEMLSGSAALEYKAAVNQGALTAAAFTAAVRATPTGFFEKLATDAQSALDAVQALSATLEALCGIDAPGLSALERAVEEVGRFARRTLADRGVAGAPAARTPPLPVTVPNPVVQPAAPLTRTPVASRDQAYALLAEIAQFLIVTEPHSPTPYLIRRAITWGSMGLNELLQELVDEDSSRKTIQRLLQMPES